MHDDLELVRSRTSIVDVIGQQLPLKKAGKYWKGLCPFHQDKNPSFYVSDELGRYRCWACSAKGDVFNWVMETQKVEFSEALQILAKKCGVTLSKKSSYSSPKKLQYEEAMLEGLHFFCDEFERCKEAQTYCSGRGLDAKTIHEWQIGYAPHYGEALAIHLKKKGFSLTDCKTLSLLERDTQGGFYDRFRGRLIFPIHNERGEVVGFGGRLLGEGHPKYINSSETPLFNKGRLLYGFHKAREHISKKGQAILVEGYLDVIACHRAGLGEAVASLGTSLTSHQAKLLKRWCEHVTIMYDSDEAGQNATERSIPILTAEGIKVRLVLLPPDQDPDTMLHASGAKKVIEISKAGISPLDYRVSQIQNQYSVTDPRYWEEVVAVLAEAEDTMEFEKHLFSLAALYPDLRNPVAAQRALRKKVARIKKQGQQPQASSVKRIMSRSENTSSQIHAIETALVYAFLSDVKELRKVAWETYQVNGEFITGLGHETAVEIRQTFIQNPPTGPARDWLEHLQSQTVKELFIEIAFQNGEDIDSMSEQVLLDALQKLEDFREQQIVNLLKSAEQLDDEKLSELHSRLKKLKNKATY